MNLKLPNGEEQVLDTNLSVDKRKEVVYTILSEWGDYFEQTWDLPKTRVCLEILSSYLTKEVKEQEK